MKQDFSAYTTLTIDGNEFPVISMPTNANLLRVGDLHVGCYESFMASPVLDNNGGHCNAGVAVAVVGSRYHIVLDPHGLTEGAGKAISEGIAAIRQAYRQAASFTINHRQPGEDNHITTPVLPGMVVVYGRRTDSRSPIVKMNTRFVTLEDGAKFNQWGHEYGRANSYYGKLVQGIYLKHETPVGVEPAKIAAAKFTKAQTTREEAWSTLCTKTAEGTQARADALQSYIDALEAEKIAALHYQKFITRI